jgi:Ca2+/Na+ antiporter
MNDAFYEQLVARKSGSKDIVIRIGSIALIALFLIFTMPLLGMFSVLLTILLAFLAYYFLFPKLNVEYEYTLLNHEMEIDAIYNKSKRKKLATFDIQQAEIIAPKGSPRLNSYHPEKTLDYSSGDSSAKTFAVITFIDKKNTCIIIEPDEKMLGQIKSWMGMKIWMD